MLMLMVKKQVAPLSTRRSSTLLQQQSKHNGHQPTKLQIPAAMYSSPSAKKPSAYKAAPRTFVTSAPQCPRCDKSVYAAEQVLGPGGREYHKPCLTCIACKRTVQPGSFQEHEGDPYCKHCYAKHHGPKGLGYGGAMTGDYVDPILSRSPYSSPARSATYGSHRNSGAFNEPPSSRYGNHESPTKDSQASTSAAFNSISRTSIESPIGMYRSSRLQEMEDDDMEGDSRRTSEDSNRRINADQQAEAPDFDDDAPRASSSTSPVKARTLSSASASFRGSPLKHSVPTELPPPPSPTSRRPISPTSSIGTSATSSSGPSADNVGVGFKSNLGLLNSSGPDLCRRCQKAVYFAEQVMAGGHKWHKRCLRCAKCNKALDSHLHERENLPYCKRCYDDQWGLKSQGFVLRPGLY